MDKAIQRYLRKEIIVRVAADAALVNAALFLAVVGHYLWEVGVSGGGAPAALLMEHADIYLKSFGFLTLITTIVFGLNGFYTYGRYYQHPYKLLVGLQAVSLSYLLFSFIVLVFWPTLAFPRSVLVMGWFLTAAFTIGARALLEFWRSTVWPSEERPARSLANGRRRERILLIGGAGYIGSALLPKLLARDYDVRLFDLFLYGTEPIEKQLTHPNLELVRADFRHVDQMVEAMRDVDGVIHLGGLVGDPACAVDEELTIEVNLTATRMIGEVAKGSGVQRIVFASTCSVYGASDELLDEQSELNPVSLYARSKIASERVLRELASEHFAPVILRFATVYGLSGRARFDLVVNLLAAKAVLDGEITVHGGNQWRPFVHVDDAALSVLMAYEAPLPLVNGESFNVGWNQQNFTIQQVGEFVQRQVPSARLVQMGNGGDPRNYRVSFDKIRRRLSFVPQWTLQRGIQQIVEAIESGKITDYRNIEYSNASLLTSQESGVSDLLRAENGWAQQLLDEAAPQYRRLIAS